MISTTADAAEMIEGHLFITRSEYQSKGKACACPSDRARNNSRCGRRAALCRNGGANILDCSSKVVTSIKEYKAVKRKKCGVDF